MSDTIKLPSNMRVCEDCSNFQALTNGNETICAKLGRIPNGVALCQVKGVSGIVRNQMVDVDDIKKELEVSDGQEI